MLRLESERAGVLQALAALLAKGLARPDSRTGRDWIDYL